MDYIKQSNNEQPFEGLTLNEKKYLWVYMCYIHHPNFTPEEIKKRWGEVLSIDERPTVFDALEIVKKIKEELDDRVAPIKDTVVDDPRTDSLCSNIFGVFLVLVIGLTWWIVISKKEAETARKREAEAAQQLKKIDEEFGVDTVLAYNHLNGIEKYSKDARCRKHLCEVFGIGVKRKLGLRMIDCPIYGNCLEKAAESKAFCKGFSSLGWVDDAGLKLLREESKEIGQLKVYDISLLQRVAKLGDADAIKEIAECYRDGKKIGDYSAAKFWYSKYILAVSDLKELYKLRELFSTEGKFACVDLYLQVLKRLVSLGDVNSLANSLALLEEKVSVSHSHRASEYLYQVLCDQALCDNVALSVDTMRICADLFEKSNQETKAIKFYEKIANQDDYDAICWLGIYWYEQITFSYYDGAKFFPLIAHISRRGNGCCEREKSEKALSEAKKWLELAVSGGGELDMYLKLSHLYFVQRKYRRMIDCLRDALKFGSVDVAIKLGEIYKNGLYDVVANRAEAKRLYLIAANKGHHYAQLQYACLLDSPEEAFEWVGKAAKQGDVEAQYQFGRLCDYFGWGAWGDGHWKTLKCSCEIDRRYIEPTISPKDGCEKYQKAAISWYRRAAKNGHKSAEYKLSEHNVTLE